MKKEIEKIGWLTHDQWIELRKKGIGGSDAGAIIGVNKYRSAYDVWADKTNMINEQIDNEAMRQGRDLEEYIAKRFEEMSGKKVIEDKRIYKNPEYPFAFANVDRFVKDENAILECKTTTDTSMKYEVPPSYRAQCMHYMAVTGAAKAYIAILVFGKDFNYHIIERDQSEIDKLMEKENLFWNENVIKKIRPQMQGIEKTNETINKIYNSPTKTTCRLSCIDEIKRYISLTERIKKLETEKRAIQQMIKCEMGNNTYAEFQGGKVTWKRIKQNILDTNKLKKEISNISEYYIESTKSIFNITESKQL